MRKMVSIGLLFILFVGSFTPNMDTCELSKFPQLMHHYYEHLEKGNEQLSFYEFLALHYGDGDSAKEHRSQENHDNLPLHHHSFHSVVLGLQEIHSFSFYYFETTPVLNVSYFYTDYSEYSSSLLLPPKLLIG